LETACEEIKTSRTIETEPDVMHEAHASDALSFSNIKPVNCLDNDIDGAEAVESANASRR
jgi:hypothetical protein